MQEYLLRLNDYFLNQVTNSFVDTNPCEDIVRRTAIKLDPFFIVQAQTIDEQNTKFDDIMDSLFQDPGSGLIMAKGSSYMSDHDSDEFDVPEETDSRATATINQSSAFTGLTETPTVEETPDNLG